jgi:DNA-binding response OmpR family regulator
MRFIPMAKHHKPAILVVDDEVDTCRNLADILSEYDYEVDIATSGQDALDLVRRKLYDVALLDLKMPGIDGVTLYRRIRKLQPSTVAMIVTAYASDPTTKEALSAGAWQVLSKPVDIAGLLPLVDEAIHQPIILVVDDDEDLCENLWDLFRSRNFRVAVAHTEKKALEALQGDDYQVILVDLKLPGGDGRGILRAVHQQHPESRTILITGHPEEFSDILAGARNQGADAVCYKPFDLRALLQTIDRLIRRDGTGE